MFGRAIERTWSTEIKLWWERVDFVGREVKGARSCAAGRRPKIVSEAVTCPPQTTPTLYPHGYGNPYIID